jgi:hypothetical protein
MLGHPRLVPDDFDVPARASGSDFVIVPLDRSLLALDYESYMSSVEHLQATYNVDEPFVIGGQKWPGGVTPDEAFLDVGWCEFERVLRTAFAYAVLDVEETVERGCVYVFPCKKAGFAAECRMWVRESELSAGFDQELERWFKDWVAEQWPFDASQVAWPGRGISWTDWERLPAKGLV